MKREAKELKPGHTLNKGVILSRVQSVCKYFFFPISEFSYYVLRFLNHIFLSLTFPISLSDFYLTRLTWLTHTSLLPSNWDLDELFALAVELGQVYMANKKFPIFLNAEKGNG